MIYVIVALIIVVLFLGWVHVRKLKNDQLRNSCGGGCAGCAGRNSCGKDEKK